MKCRILGFWHWHVPEEVKKDDEKITVTLIYFDHPASRLWLSCYVFLWLRLCSEFRRLTMAPLETFELGISVFSFDEDYTYSLLEPVFSGLCHGADYERLSEKKPETIFLRNSTNVIYKALILQIAMATLTHCFNYAAWSPENAPEKIFSNGNWERRLSLSYEKHGDILCILFQSEILTGKTCRI